MRSTAADASTYRPLLCIYNQAYGHVTGTIAGQQDQKSGGRNLTWSQRKEKRVGTCQAFLCLFINHIWPWNSSESNDSALVPFLKSHSSSSSEQFQSEGRGKGILGNVVLSLTKLTVKQPGMPTLIPDEWNMAYKRKEGEPADKPQKEQSERR